MDYIGISTGFHDAGLSVIDSNGEITFAGHSERYSKLKHDKNLSVGLIEDALSYVKGPYQLHYYEKPWLKFFRQLRAGEKLNICNLSSRKLIGHTDLLQGKVTNHYHHLSHAAAGFQTSPFKESLVIVIDAIGEFDTASIWAANYDSNGIAKYKKLWSQTYPDSIGLFYSAMTQHVGLRPLDEEYILMGMAGWGKPIHTYKLEKLAVADYVKVTFKDNFHAGINKNILFSGNDYDIASSTQFVTEKLIYSIIEIAKSFNWSNNLVYMGGVALNCLANRKLGNYFNNIWIMPNPGDAGSSLGAAALGYGKKLNWKNAYLGHNIDSPYPVQALADHLIKHKIAGVASGRAEFGPRALGNRSLLADPRGPEIKDLVNDIKRRQKFRPFAPVILEEYASTYFVMPSGWVDSRYMQIVAKCKCPTKFPAIVHVDGTSRVQTVPKDGSGIRALLEYWFKKTGCPMLLNTSLNIRGEPMVNDRYDADRFENTYGVKVFS